MPQGHSHETTELRLLFLSEGLRIEAAGNPPIKTGNWPVPRPG